VGQTYRPVDHAVLRPLSAVSRERGLRAKNREWGRGDYLILVPESAN
jgi:hypothetical protein